MPLTDDELKSILPKLDDVMRQAQGMSEQIKTRLNDRRRSPLLVANTGSAFVDFNKRRHAGHVASPCW